jgi:hypothetical protein
MINTWKTRLLEENNVTDISKVSENVLINTIEDVQGTISNERLWAHADPIHNENIANLEAYLEILTSEVKKRHRTITKYNEYYNDVRCTGVDWENLIFELTYNGYSYSYKQQGIIHSSADTDHIKMLIGEFLTWYGKKAAENLNNTLSYVEKILTEYEEYENPGEYETGYYFACAAIKQRLIANISNI